MVETLQELLKYYMYLSFVAVLPCVLHVYFCLRRNKWMGLILPTLFLVAVLTTCIRNLFLGGDPLWVLGSFCLLNMPTIGGLIVYVLCRRRVERKRVENSEGILEGETKVEDDGEEPELKLESELKWGSQLEQSEMDSQMEMEPGDGE